MSPDFIRRGRRKVRVVSPVMGRMSCPGRESDCLKSAETEVGISAGIYDSNWAREGPGSERRHAGTVEGISARIHVANSRGDRAEETRRSDRTVQIHCGRGTTPACRWGPASSLNRGMGGSTEVGSR